MDDFVNKIIELALGQGLWAVLYIYLFFRMLNENKTREDRYQATIDRLSESIEVKVAHIQETLDDMVSRNSKP